VDATTLGAVAADESAYIDGRKRLYYMAKPALLRGKSSSTSCELWHRKLPVEPIRNVLETMSGNMTVPLQAIALLLNHSLVRPVLIFLFAGGIMFLSRTL
jgi:hypothetical protein